MVIQNANKGLEYFDAGSEELLKIREAEIKRGKGKRNFKEGYKRETRFSNQHLSYFISKM